MYSLLGRNSASIVAVWVFVKTTALQLPKLESPKSHLNPNQISSHVYGPVPSEMYWRGFRVGIEQISLALHSPESHAYFVFLFAFGRAVESGLCESHCHPYRCVFSWMGPTPNIHTALTPRSAYVLSSGLNSSI